LPNIKDISTFFAYESRNIFASDFRKQDEIGKLNKSITTKIRIYEKINAYKKNNDSIDCFNGIGNFVSRSFLFLQKIGRLVGQIISIQLSVQYQSHLDLFDPKFPKYLCIVFQKIKRNQKNRVK